MSATDLHHLAAAFALDAVGADERSAFLEHLAECEICREDVIAFHEVQAHLGASLAQRPSADLRARVLAEVAVTRQLPPIVGASREHGGVVSLDAARRRRRTVWTAGLAGAAAAALATVVSITAFGNDARDPFAEDLALVMEQPDGQVLDLARQGGVDGGFKVAWSNNLGKAVLIGEELPPAPDGSAYELWLITPEQSMAMYVLDPAEDGNVHVTLDAPAEPSAWAITVEPSEGSATATGDIIFVSEV